MVGRFRPGAAPGFDCRQWRWVCRWLRISVVRGHWRGFSIRRISAVPGWLTHRRMWMCRTVAEGRRPAEESHWMAWQAEVRLFRTVWVCCRVCVPMVVVYRRVSRLVNGRRGSEFDLGSDYWTQSLWRNGWLMPDAAGSRLRFVARISVCRAREWKCLQSLAALWSSMWLVAAEQCWWLSTPLRQCSFHCTAEIGMAARIPVMAMLRPASLFVLRFRCVGCLGLRPLSGRCCLRHRDGATMQISVHWRRDIVDVAVSDAAMSVNDSNSGRA